MLLTWNSVGVANVPWTNSNVSIPHIYTVSEDVLQSIVFCAFLEKNYTLEKISNSLIINNNLSANETNASCVISNYLQDLHNYFLPVLLRSNNRNLKLLVHMTDLFGYQFKQLKHLYQWNNDT